MKGGARLLCAKEIREMFRDKRVVYSALLGPVFLVFLFLFLFGFLQQTLRSPKAVPLHYVADGPDPRILKELQAGGVVKPTRLASDERAAELLRKGDARVVLKFPRDFDERIESGRSAVVVAMFDPEQPTSSLALSEFEKRVAKENLYVLAQVLEREGVSREFAEPIKLERLPVKAAESFGGFLAGILPYLIVIWAFYGGFSIAADLVAGEKERSTLETLLICPASRTDIALGKFWALAALCFVSAVSSIVAVAIAGLLPIKTIQELFPQGLHISPAALSSMVAVIVPLSAFFAALLLAFSALARNVRECQGYLTLISFIVLMPAVFSQFIGYTEYHRALWVNFVPILNSANVLRAAMLGNGEWVPLGITIGLNLALALIGVRLVVVMFGRENVLWRI
jgi:sodium transport system permease protein